jgi:hypothetical protein
VYSLFDWRGAGKDGLGASEMCEFSLPAGGSAPPSPDFLRFQLLTTDVSGSFAGLFDIEVNPKEAEIEDDEG